MVRKGQVCVHTMGSVQQSTADKGVIQPGRGAWALMSELSQCRVQGAEGIHKILLNHELNQRRGESCRVGVTSKLVQ